MLFRTAEYPALFSARREKIVVYSAVLRV